MRLKEAIEQLYSISENSASNTSKQGDQWDKDVEALNIVIPLLEAIEREDEV